ncbi:hypothetical protein D3C81_1439110 [compost metagenome]
MVNDLIFGNRTQCRHNITLLHSYFFGSAAFRQVHRHHHQNLQHMILEHISNCACLIEICGPILNPNKLIRRNLNIRNIAIRPQGLKYWIRETKYLQILNHRLTKVVVNPVDLFLSKSLIQALMQGSCRFQIMTEWLLDNEPSPSFNRTESTLIYILCNGPKVFRGYREIEHTIFGNFQFIFTFLHSR